MSDKFLMLFRAWLESDDASPKTVYAYVGDIRGFIEWFEANIERFELASVTTNDLTRYRTYLMERRLKPATINRKLQSIKRMVAYGLDMELIQLDITRAVKRMSEVKPPPRQIDDKEERAFFRALERFGNPRDSAVCLMLRHAGLRASELCNLTRDEVTLNPRSGNVYIRSGKGNKDRNVPLNVTVRDALTAYLATRTDNQRWLYTGERGAKLTTRALDYIIKKYARLAGIQKISAHWFRHRFGYLATKESGLNIASTLMGHSSLEMTQRYSQPTQEDLQRAVENIA